MIAVPAQPDPRRRRARLSAVVEQARRPEFFTRFGVPDTLDGRFELICLHAFLYLHRLKSEPCRARRVAQRFFDTMFADFDRSLRELGTGDLSVGRQVKRMAEAFYGRIRAYEQGLDGDEDAVAAALDRNLYGTAPAKRRPACGDGRAICGARRRRSAGQPRRRPAGRRRSPSARRDGADAPIGAPEFSRVVAADPARRRAVPPEIAATEAERAALGAALRAAVARPPRPPRSSWCARAAARSSCAPISRRRSRRPASSRSSRFAGTVRREFHAALRRRPNRSPAMRCSMTTSPPSSRSIGEAIDIGEAVAQEFSLALPPFPRARGRGRRGRRRVGHAGGTLCRARPFDWARAAVTRVPLTQPC